MPKTSLFKSKYLKTDVTAVKFFHNFILAGIGDTLHIYDKHTGNLVETRKISQGGSKIHGICPRDDKLLIYGGCMMTVFEVNLKKDKFVENPEFQSVNVKDWILSATFLSEPQVGAVVMHNKLIIIDSTVLKVIKTIECTEKCLLYSAFLCQQTNDRILVISGSVFGDIFMWYVATTDWTSEEKVTRLQEAHKGAVFSIDYQAGYLCSTSDDRSTVFWTLDDRNEIKSKRQLFRHESRVFQSKICSNFLVTGGEDSKVNLWNFRGDLVRVLEPFTFGSIWCLDVQDNLLVVGGASGGIVTFNLAEHYRIYAKTIEEETPLKVGILRDGSFAVLGSNGGLYQCDCGGPNVKIDQRSDLIQYNLFQMSKCRRLLAMCGFHGQLYLYKLGPKLLLYKSHVIDSEPRVVAFHFLNCQKFLTFHSQKLHLWSDFKACCDFKMIETTTCACLTKDDYIVVGDRRGAIHLFRPRDENAVCVVKKQLNYLGVTHVDYDRKTDTVFCLGRSGSLLKFSVENDELILVGLVKVPFSWLARYDVIADQLFGFSGNCLVVWSCAERRKTIEFNCGGGHRSWDQSGRCIVYVKDKKLNIVAGYAGCSKTIADQSHGDTINCARGVGDAILFTASEDTTIRAVARQPPYVAMTTSDHVSSVRCLVTCQLDGKWAVFSGGGRGQIVASLFFMKNKRMFWVKQWNYQEKNNRDTRIMDLVCWNRQLFAACSDGVVKVFRIAYENNRITLIWQRDVVCSNRKCILKVAVMDLNSNFAPLVTFGSDGNAIVRKQDGCDVMATFRLHQSGINCFSYRQVDRFLFLLTGGDDNALMFNCFLVVNDSLQLFDKTTLTDVKSHCAQITGVFLTDDYFLTCSIDQKLLIFKWRWRFDNSGDRQMNIDWEMQGRYDSSISDVQGMFVTECGNHFEVIVYGEGHEIINCQKC